MQPEIYPHRIRSIAMPVDYSKWDALELSDDSDFEPHPNVDKRSFIRAKQNQIHQQRADRKNQIETLKYERMVNDGLLRRIDTLLSVLRENEAKAKDDPDAFLYQALISSAGDPDQDEAPNPPPGIHTQDKEPIKYSQMMGVLVDQVKKEVDESGKENGFHGYIKGVEGHKKKVTQLQKDLQTKLSELEKEEGRKITSDKLHDGFNSSMVMKSDGNKSVGSSSKKDTTVEVLNPAALRGQELMKEDGAVSSGAEADVDEAGGPLADEESAEVTALGKRFLKIKYGDYKACLQFISDHPEVMKEKETDGLLVEAFDAQLKGNNEYARLCVHQALLLQYCRTLGRDGVHIFFKR